MKWPWQLPPSNIWEPAGIPTDFDAKRKRAEQASEFLGEKSVFSLAVKSLKRQLYDDLMRAPTSQAGERIVIKLQALEEIPLEMSRFVNDYKMALDKQRKHG